MKESRCCLEEKSRRFVYDGASVSRFLLTLCFIVLCRVGVSSTRSKASGFFLFKNKREVCSIVISTPDLAVGPLRAFQNKSTPAFRCITSSSSADGVSPLVLLCFFFSVGALHPAEVEISYSTAAERRQLMKITILDHSCQTALVDVPVVPASAL